MFLSRSLARVRPFGPMGLGRPLVLDYKRGRIRAYTGTGEWDRTRDGSLWALDERGHAMRWRDYRRLFPDALLRQTLRLPSMEEVADALCRLLIGPNGHAVRQGGYGFLGSSQFYPPVLGITPTGTYTITTLALDSDYTYGSAGDAVGHRSPMIAAKTFDTIYFYVSSYTGTAANVNDILVSVRNDSSDKPGSTLHDSVSKDPGAATGWIAASGFTFGGSANTVYWIVVADPDGGSTDAGASYATVGVRVNNFAMPQEEMRKSGTVTNGFATTVATAAASQFVVKFSDGTVIGNPYASSASSTSSTNKRGWFISNGFTAALSVYGFVSAGGIANCDSALILEGTAAPDDTVARTFSVQLPSTSEVGYVGTPYTCPAQTPESFVFNYASSATGPAKLQIGTGVDANLRKAMLGGGSWYWREENQTPNPDDWSNDDQDSSPRASILIEDQVESAAAAAASAPRAAGASFNIGM